MPLAAGTRLGVYEVTAQIGEGGMGQVYRARDTALNRDVALKILPDAFASDPDRLARFRREAQTLAALNHPNIAQIHGLEDSGGLPALVIELVEGEDLSAHIARGPIPLADALAIAKQIAEALEAAHELGIIHRDLKPANIKVRSDGTVKVLDFGLAKLAEPMAAGSNVNVSMSPTLSLNATMAGLILGTAAYMAPEQARGKPVDKRADVWAFGAVLFEMLTGRPPFPGDDVSHVLARVIDRDPDWSLLPKDLPPALGTYLRRCLVKDPRQRIRDMGDVRLALDGAFDDLAQRQTAATLPVPSRRTLWKRALPIVVSAVVASAIVGGAAWALRPALSPSPVTRFVFTLPEGQRFTVVNNQMLAVSPDGGLVVYVADYQLYLRSMSELEARPIPGTRQELTPFSPVFSPDSRSIAFYSQVDRAIKKVALSGGAAVTICQAEPARNGRISWDGDAILFGQNAGIMRVSASGGQPEAIVSVKDGEGVHGPQVLPGGEWVLFTVSASQTPEGWDRAEIVVQSLKTSERKTLISGGSDGRYVPTGHLVYALGGVLFAVPFDLQSLAVTGGPVPIVEGIRRASTGLTGAAQFSVSRTGSLVFIPGPVSTSTNQSDLALIDRNGTVEPLKLPPGPYEYPRLSPDGKRVAFGSDDGKDAVVWIYDLSGTSSMRPLTLRGRGGRNRVPVWSVDGEHVAFQSDREGDLAIFRQRADGTTPAERLTKPDKDAAHIPESWSPDGKTLLFSVARASTYSLEALSLPDRKATPFGGIQSAFPPTAAFSPDGKWVAYSMGVTGTPSGSMYVQPFPATGATYQISQGGGIHPTWSPDGKELIYSPRPGQLVVVSVTTQPAFTFGNPVPMTRAFADRGAGFERNNDVTLDGKRFLGVVAAGQTTASGASAVSQIQVVLNWFEELKTRVPSAL
jgi:serine/threonine-protein kinase